MDEVTKIDISDELRQTAGYLISGTIADGEVSTFMLTDAADEIDSLRSRLAAQSAAPVGDEFWAEKSDLEIARLINLGLLMVQGISEEDAGFDLVTTINDAGLAKVAEIIGKVRAAAPQSPSVSPVGDDYPEDQS